MRNVEIISSGIALPERVVESDFIDKTQGFAKGYTKKVTGVTSRHYAINESAVDLAVTAINHALTHSPVALEEIDCLISASGTMVQAIPYNAAKIHASLDLPSTVPAFDINMTCLSALMAIDLAATMIQAGQYQHVLIVSAEVASVGIDWSQPETGGLFGDGAAALVISSSVNHSKKILASHFETHSVGVDFCQIKGGGSLYHPSKIEGDYTKFGMFEMKGKEAYRLTASVIDNFMAKLMSKAELQFKDIDWVVPHQASYLALEHMRKKLNISADQLVNILKVRGNQIAASLPSAYYELMHNKNVQSGDKVLLIGTSAGLSIGGIILTI